MNDKNALRFREVSKSGFLQSITSIHDLLELQEQQQTIYIIQGVCFKCNLCNAVRQSNNMPCLCNTLYTIVKVA